MVCQNIKVFKLVVLQSFLLVFMFVSTSLALGDSGVGKVVCLEKDHRPRIINIYNFIRLFEPRKSGDTEKVLFETTANQIELAKKYNFPATYALQYDALMDKRYQKLLKENLTANDEIGGWWEIVRPLVEKAGMKWRGRFAWDWHADVGFSTGYTPKEREKLIDVYMADFKEIFGYYPATVGSWFIDAHSLKYMADKYNVETSCNCKDQWGTDGYTLWGGYWNQAYYPSVKNAYMPAQTIENQIPIPIFRMLGSDPIYQYDSERLVNDSIVTLEPIYKISGRNPKWVEWFFRSLVDGPCLSFGYTQTGQENSFTWARIENGLKMQFEHIAKLAAEKKIRLETLKETGRWFKKEYSLTPASSVVAMDDWDGQGHKSIWYISRFYRVNIFFEKDSFYLRDIHVFDEKYASRYLAAPVQTNYCLFDTLGVMDGRNWGSEGHRAGIRLVKINPDGGFSNVAVKSVEVEQVDRTQLRISIGTTEKFNLVITCSEGGLSFETTGSNLPLAWGLVFDYCREQSGAAIKSIDGNKISYEHNGFAYSISCKGGEFKLYQFTSSQNQDIVAIARDNKIVLNLSQK